MEVWIEYREKFLISSEGRVLKKVVKEVKGRFLKVYEEVIPYFSESDYTGAGYYNLYVGTIEGKPTTERMHRVVASAFMGNKSGDWEVDHIDGDRSNNKLANLRWVTHSENMKAAKDRGAFDEMASKHDWNKLEEILQLFESGANLVQISVKTGMDRASLNRFRSGMCKEKIRKKFIKENLSRFVESAKNNKYKFTVPDE